MKQGRDGGGMGVAWGGERVKTFQCKEYSCVKDDQLDNF